ncbi:MAG: crossover junction endodeoxyribonuclease RuvC [Candidatus Saccharibacteria bacterium]
MKILGIDPGTATTGFGVITKEQGKLSAIDYGVISTSKRLDMHLRLNIIFQDLTDLIHHHKPNIIAVEKLYFVKNITTGISVGQARGVVLLTAARADLTLLEFTPLQVKQAVTGYGQANKKQIQEMVTKILKLPSLPQPDDAADALAIAICASSQTRI